MATLSPSRRRQRSVRVSVAVALLVLGTVAVAVALAVASVPALSVASVLSLLCGWAAARIVWAELTESRRTHARDRAVQAQSFRSLFTERSAEHATFASAMADRLAARDREVRELEGTLRLSEGRANAAEERVRREARRTAQAQERVVELEVLLALRSEDDGVTTLDSGSYADLDTVVDLLRWEDRSQALQDDAPVAKRA